MLPNRIRMSKKATSKFAFIKGKTGLTPNILARLAIMLAINEGSNLVNASVSDQDGQELSQSVLFGEHALFYDLLINQYIHDYELFDYSTNDVIVRMIEIGAFRMGHIRSLVDIETLY